MLYFYLCVFLFKGGGHSNFYGRVSWAGGGGGAETARQPHMVWADF